MADPKPAGGKGSFMLLLSFMLVAFVLFDPNLRDLLARGVGAVFDPLFGFGGRAPLWTVMLAGVTMILASTVIRHFLVDWVRMARVQEVMRHFQKEFREAQKANNSYRIKRLTEAQPDIMKMQADMSGDQLKPMAFTMIVVIPIFIWLSGFMLAPVHYEAEVEATTPILVVGFGDMLWDAEVVHPGETATLELTRTTHLHALRGGPGDASGHVELRGETGVVEFDVRDAPPVPEGIVLELDAGEHTHRTVDNLDVWSREEPARLERALLLVEDAQGVVRRVVVVGPQTSTFTLEGPARVRILVPAPPNADPRGNPLQVHVDDERHDVAAGDVWLLPTLDGQATVTPKSIRMPWNPDWDLNENWKFLPRWILLYTLVSIPIGTVVQRVLKMWEFKRVDLDQDGVPAGKSL